MRILILALAPAAQLIGSAATLHGHVVVGVQAAATEFSTTLRDSAAEVVIASGDPAILTAALLAECDSLGVRVLALVETAVERSNVAALGLYDTIDPGAPWEQFERLLGGQVSTGHVAASTAPPAVKGHLPEAPGNAAHPASSELPDGAVGAERRGTVIAVWGPAGSPGRTSIAIGIAAEIAAAGYSVALGDVDTHSASVAPALGMLDEAPGFAAACRLAGADALTRLELERIGQRYLTGNGSFWVLTGIGRASRWPELSADRVRATIAECRRWVDYTVLDTGFSLENDEEISSDLFAPRRNAATTAALGDADIVIAVGAADPVGLSRFLRAHVDLLDIVDQERITVVMNRVRASAIGMNPASQVAQTLARFGGIDASVLVPNDQAGMDAAVLSGRTLAEVAPRSPARGAIQQLVARILPARPVANGRAAAKRARSRFEPALGN